MAVCLRNTPLNTKYTFRKGVTKVEKVEQKKKYFYKYNKNILLNNNIYGLKNLYFFLNSATICLNSNIIH